ncbi:MAG: penicillin-binding protein 1C [Planctomycetes bacterium]|nr:penicillin-binding protein 1C [Planctomycetota bacterium]
MASPWRRRLRRTVRVACAIPVLAVAAFFGLDALYPFPEELLTRPATSPFLTASDSDLIRVQLTDREEWRRPVPLARISSNLIEATIAVEDRRFRTHLGVDPIAIVRAGLQNLAGGRRVSGASTLTMQWVKMRSGNTRRTVWNKLQEAFRALQVERILSKNEILERYLNLAPYVGNHRGVEAASLELFGKHAADLSRPEAYLLAGLPQSPARHNPRRHRESAARRRATVLAACVQTGNLPAVEAQAIASTWPTLQSAPRPLIAPHFARMAFEQRPAGGRSTLDSELQRHAEEVVARRVRNLPEGADVALVAIELETGAVRALVGSADVNDPMDGQVNGATAWRSPGSALKPFLYAAAFEAHLATPDTQIDDSPMEIAGWAPNNFDGEFVGMVSAREALRRSLNIPAMRMAHLAGLPRVIGVLESAGVRFLPGRAQEAGLALATGAAEVRLIDLTCAYATLGRKGRFLPWVLFEDELELQGNGTRVLSEPTCENLLGILSSKERVENARPDAHHFAWKTGTSSAFRDAWSLGYDGKMAVGIWVGNFSGAPDRAFTGSEAATPILVEFLCE